MAKNPNSEIQLMLQNKRHIISSVSFTFKRRMKPNDEIQYILAKWTTYKFFNFKGKFEAFLTNIFVSHVWDNFQIHPQSLGIDDSLIIGKSSFAFIQIPPHPSPRTYIQFQISIEFIFFFFKNLFWNSTKKILYLCFYLATVYDTHS